MIANSMHKTLTDCNKHILINSQFCYVIEMEAICCLLLIYKYQTAMFVACLSGQPLNDANQPTWAN